MINQFKAIENMDEEDKNVVKKLIDAFIITKKQCKISAVKKPKSFYGKVVSNCC